MSEIMLSARDVVREYGGGSRGPIAGDVSPAAASRKLGDWRTTFSRQLGSFYRSRTAGLFGIGRKPLRAVDGVSIDVRRGRTLGVVGESGCGKSTLARMMVGLLPPTAGTIDIDGRSVEELAREDRKALHRKMQMVFQDPLGSLNPRKTVRSILEAPLKALHGMGQKARRDRVAELMSLVSLRAEFTERYPHEFSGGQAQRIGIARALAAEPELIILDEPVSALDVSVQAQVLSLLADLQARLDLTYVFISHDLAVVETISDEVVVMYLGRIVELGSRAEIFADPQHEYTRLLLSSVPGTRKGQAGVYLRPSHRA
jgi:ABC-type glutathione transport system ATPase component